VEQSTLADGDAPIGGPLRPASRRRQQRLFGERAAGRLDVSDVFHCSMRAGGGRAAARRWLDQRVTVECSAA
jgi:hypothetical protein